MVDTVYVSGGKQVLVCPECKNPILDSQPAVITEYGTEGVNILLHQRCDIDPEDPSTLSYYLNPDP